MAAYLTAAKQAEIVKNYKFALPTSSLQTFLVEIAAAIAQAEGLAEESDVIFMKKVSMLPAASLFSLFTDGGATIGTLDFAANIPAGAFVYQVVCTSLTGFAGDTSATIQIGDGTDVDRYMTGTPDVFSDVALGIPLGVPSGEQYHTVVKTPKITITTGADFTSVSAGDIGLDIYYIENNS